MFPFKRKKRFKKQSLYILIVIVMGLLISLGVIWNFINVKDTTGTSNTLQLIVSLVAIISGVSGVIVGLSSLRATQLDSVRDYFTSGDTEEFITARRIIYTYGKHLENGGNNVFFKNFKLPFKNKNNEDVELSKQNVLDAISFIANFFHQWGLLTKNRYLPLWVFESSSGVAVYRLFEYSKEIIAYHRENNNPFYAENFEWLYNKIKKTYKYEINIYLTLHNKKEIN